MSDFCKVLIMISFVLCLTQCKKKAQEVIPYNNKAVNISLRVNGGAKINFDPETGDVNFTNNDELLVVNNGVFIGKMRYYDENLFMGTITNPSEDDYLHFYHLGNIEIEGLTEGVTTGCTISTADQINNIPLISYGHSYELYSSEITTYGALLENKCAMVRFDVTTPQEFAATCITGMKNKIEIDFSDASFTYGMENEGKIVLPTGSGERWAVLLPQDAVGLGEEGSAFSGRYIGYRGAVPAIKVNECLVSGVEVVMNTVTKPEGAMNGYFTVNSDGKRVVFSKANLTYTKASKEWRFKDDQYTLIENEGYIGVNCSELPTISLFCWGQSGYNHGAISYLPYDTDAETGHFRAYGNWLFHLYSKTGKADWGYNKIANGGCANKQWRTLRDPEYNHIFAVRPNAADKYGYGVVEGIKGVIILPDDWVEPYDDCFVSGCDLTFESNNYDLSQWASMEEAGAVFLPFTGVRFGNFNNGVNLCGRIWSSTRCSSSMVYGLDYTYASALNYHNEQQRNAGMSVRLVCE